MPFLCDLGAAAGALLRNMFKIFHLWVQDDHPCTGLIGIVAVERMVADLRQNHLNRALGKNGFLRCNVTISRGHPIKS